MKHILTYGFIKHYKIGLGSLLEIHCACCSKPINIAGGVRMYRVTRPPTKIWISQSDNPATRSIQKECPE